MKLFPRQHYLVLLVMALCLFIFGFTEATQAAQSGKGWYQNSFSSGSVCDEGEWTAEVKIFDTEAAPLTAGTIEIRAILWEGDMPTTIYSDSFSNTSTVVVCISAEGSQDDLMALDVRVSKINYKDLWSYQRARSAGSAIANMTWTRDIYLARNDEPVNIAHSFPVNNQVVSNSQNISFEIDTLLRPGSSQVPEIIIEAINETTEEFFVRSFEPPESMIQEGTIVFPPEQYPEGRYLWYVRLMEDENNFLYPNLGYDQFILDITPPVVNYPEASYPLSAEANITLTGKAQDTLSGLKKIEIYLENELKKTCSYNGTTLEQSCSVNVGVLGQGTFTVEVVAEDMGGLVKEKTRTFIIGDKASITFTAWGLGLSEAMQGVGYYHLSGFGSGKTYETTYSFESLSSIYTTARLPSNINFEGEPYQIFGAGGCNRKYEFSSGYNYVICGTSAGVGETKYVGALYSNSINVLAWIVNGPSIPVDIKNISGTIGDFEEGETRKTTFTIKSYEPVEATLEAPATVSLSLPYTPLEEVVFSYWWRLSYYPHYGCNSISGRKCYIRAGPLYSKWLRAYYVPAPNKLEVFSFVNRKEVEGASISRVSGTWGTGGTTRYLVSKSAVIETTLRAPLSHGGETFSHWTGCDSQNTNERTCNIRSETSGTKRIAANYGVGSVDPSEEYILSVLKDGSGRVWSNPSGIDCGLDCEQIFPSGLEVTLSVEPEEESEFAGWSGDCSGTDTCTLIMNSDKSVTATFSQTTYTLTVSKTGSGTVTSSPEGIDCGTDCSETYTFGTSVVLTATRDSGWEFDGWSGDCSGTDDCTVIMDEDRSVAATFVESNQPPYVKPNSAIIADEHYCDIAPSVGQISFEWTYKDNDGDSQSHYHLQVATDPGFNNKVVDSEISQSVSPDEKGTSAVLIVPDPTTYSRCTEGGDFEGRCVAYGNSYYWRVRVKAATGNQDWSGWEMGSPSSFTTDSHAYPWPDFSHLPQNPSVGQVVFFIDNSKCYSSPGNTEYDCEDGGASIQYAWDFDYVAPTFNGVIFPSGDATTTFSESRNYEIRLKITDNTLPGPDNYCIGAGDSPVGTTLPLPEYKEVPPIIWLKNFLAWVANIFARF